MSTSYEREVILALFESGDWFDLYELHEELLLSPAQVFSVVTFLASEALCKVDGTKATLTEKGVRWVLRNRKRIFMSTKRHWSVPQGADVARLKVGQPYMPKLGSVDKYFFQKLR
ncbi:hypothetical protein [Sulfitobacter sp.]|uniref:hypothetical protein n=1 Tax=Sulfitobacter sp. TaxID=1903071 RepID=UPI003299EAD4